MAATADPASEDRPRMGVPDAAFERLGVAEGVPGDNDPTALSSSLLRAVARTATKPFAVARISGRLASGALRAGLAATAAAALGDVPAGPVAPDPKDKRFTEPAWSTNPAFWSLMQAYLLGRRALLETVEAADLEGATGAKAHFAAELLADALAPTNFLATNPMALRRAFETGGWSAIRGIRNMVHDIRHNGGWPSQVDREAFELGRNTAATPGKVVFRNELMELIQYAPSTEQVHEIPLLMSPPWINKFYMMDLSPGRSLTEWAVNNGISTFGISYRNPDASMRDIGFEDYMLLGPRTAIDVIRSITGADHVNLLGLCLGGTLNIGLLGYLNAVGERDLVGAVTALNSLVDHEDAGTMSRVFTDKATVDSLTRRMEERGFLEASEMARTFDLMRANDLIFNYVASSWLAGEKPPAFDLLAWNADSTRMPARMHSFYLRNCWLNNALARDEVELAGHRIEVSSIDNDMYIVAAVDDHITPWRSSYKTTQLVKGECRFVMSSAGHVAGVVNPPGPKARIWTNDGELPHDPDTWLANATQHQDTWWNDWVPWITKRSGDLREPPSLGNDEYPALEDAPGTYVRG